MYKTTNMIMKNPIYLLSKNNATAVILNDETISIYSNEEVSKITFIMELLYFRFSTTSYFCIIIVSSYIVLKKYINDK